MLGAVLAAIPAPAGDNSDVAGRAATWKKEYMWCNPALLGVRLRILQMMLCC